MQTAAPFRPDVAYPRRSIQAGGWELGRSRRLSEKVSRMLLCCGSESLPAITPSGGALDVLDSNRGIEENGLDPICHLFGSRSIDEQDLSAFELVWHPGNSSRDDGNMPNQGFIDRSRYALGMGRTRLPTLWSCRVRPIPRAYRYALGMGRTRHDQSVGSREVARHLFCAVDPAVEVDL